MSSKSRTPLYLNRFTTGLYTNRSALVPPVIGGIERLDAVIDGSNVELGDDMIWRRRAGISKWSAAALSTGEIPRSFHSWRTSDGVLCGTLIDVTTSVKLYDTTAAIIASVDTDDSAGKASFVSIGSSTYIANGTDRKKITKNGAAWPAADWGIIAPTAAPTFTTIASAGPNSPATAVNVTGADVDWSNPTNVYSSDDSRAAAAFSWPSNWRTDYLRATNFGFSIPAGQTILGIKAEIERSASIAAGVTRDNSVKIVKAGAESGTEHANNNIWPTTDAYDTYGDSSDLWGVSWAYSDINATDFGVSVSAKLTDVGNPTGRIDHIRLTVYYTGGFPTGDLSPTVGYRYVFCAKNSVTGHVSTASPESISTGPQTNKRFVVTSARFTDSQVDKIEIYRTVDGGSTFFYLTTIDNPASGNWEYSDNTPDASLNKAKTAPLANINDPPPSGLHDICFHAGRVWGIVGNKVYYCSGPDVINGVPEESWHPQNYVTLPANGVALLPVQFGLLAFTANDILLIQGTRPETFIPRIWLGNFGALTPTAIALYGGTVFVYTTRRRFLAIDAAINNPGFSVSNTVFTDFNPANVHLTVHEDTDKDAAVYLSNGDGKIVRLSLKLKSWSTVANIVGTGTCGAIKSVETSSGIHTLLIGRKTAAQYIMKRDLSANTDDGTAFSAWLTFGSFMLAPPGHLVAVESVLVEANAAGSYPILSFLPNKISGTFAVLPDPVDEPPELPTVAGSVIAKRHYLQSNQVGVPCWLRHMQVKLEWPAENAANELLGLAVSVSDVK